VLLKGVMTPADAKRAVAQGFQGVIVSNYGPAQTARRPAPIQVLPAIAEAVGGKSVVLVDGSFRRGSDVLKALALGARAVLLARPAIWGLAAYGADGIQTVFEMLQSDLARQMISCGTVSLKAIDRSLLRIHAPEPVAK
jgi:4-hydroxymandelate oxidase